MSGQIPLPTFVRCRQCSSPIDVWEPPGFRIDHDPITGRGTLTRVAEREVLCPECRIRTSPEARRADLTTLFRAWRITRAEIGVPANDPATLYVIQTRGSQAVPWAPGFEITAYWLKFPSWDAALPQPVTRLTPDDPGEPPLIFVWFAADILSERCPQSWLQVRWSCLDLKRPPRLELFGWDDPELSHDDLAHLMRGVGFFREWVTANRGGRQKGDFKRDRQWYLDTYRRLARAGDPNRRRRRPSQEAFLAACGTDRKTLKRNLSEFGLWPWDEFVAAAGGGRTVRRANRS